MQDSDLNDGTVGEHRAEHRDDGPILARLKRREAEAGLKPDTRTDRRKYLLPDAAVPAVIDACRRGVSETEIAKALGIGYRTWMRVRIEDERIAEVLTEARKIEEDERVGILHDLARKGQSVPAMFLLKARHGYRDFGTTGGGVEQRVNVTIHLPSPATSEAEFAKLIDMTPRQLEKTDA